MRWINRAVPVLSVALLMVFWVLPAAQRSAEVTWAGVLFITGCALYLPVAYRQFLSTWRGFAGLAIGLIAALTWLRWQWPLWWSPVPLLQNVNLVVSLLAWALLIALFASNVLLLVREDASVVFMAVAWGLLPLILIAIGIQYRHLDALNRAPLAEQTFWGVPLLWALSMLCLGPVAFLGHFLVLLMRELQAR